MSATAERGDALSRVLDAAEDASPVQAVEAVTRELGAALGATAVSFLVTDHSGRGLIRLVRSPEGSDRWDAKEPAVELPFDGGPAEQALRTQTVQVVPPSTSRAAEAPPAGQWTVLAPVTERGESLGLLEMSLPFEPGPDAMADIARTAHALGFVVIANRRHTDLFEWGQRSSPLTLPAEIQRRLLPGALTCEAGAFTLAAWLEPAATVGGDTYDYSLARDVLHLSITDAMGHDVGSALTATLCVGSLRNTRRQGESLLGQAVAANAALVEHASQVAADGFVTGLLGRLDLRTGVLTLVNAGHVAPYLARAGAVTSIELPADLPFGLFPDAIYRSTELPLEPGDRVLMVTDGVLERNATALDLRAAINETRRMHPRETTRLLADRILKTTGSNLADDATLLVLDWHGHHGNDRATVAGADPARASSESSGG